MKKVLTVLVLTGFLLAWSTPHAHSDQTAKAPPVSQTLVREGDFAIKLSRELHLGSPNNEVAAENALSAVGIAPRNGWLADYPVTPVVLGELQTSIETASASGKLSMSRSEASEGLSRVSLAVGLPIRSSEDSYAGYPPTSPDEYPDETTINNYYYQEGPPVVSYYTPPWDYYYLYNWVPYPFWYTGCFFPGFFILTDFHRVFHHHHGGRDHFSHISNHRFDGNGRAFRVDPATLNSQRITNARANPAGSRPAGFNSGNMNSAQSILNRESTRFASFSQQTGRGMTTASASTPRFNSSRGTLGGANAPANRGNATFSRQFAGNRPFGNNSGKIGAGGGTNLRSHSGSTGRSSSAPSSGSTFSQGFSGGFRHGSGFHGGFGHGLSGGFSHGGGSGGGGHGGGGR